MYLTLSRLFPTGLFTKEAQPLIRAALANMSGFLLAGEPQEAVEEHHALMVENKEKIEKVGLWYFGLGVVGDVPKRTASE